MALRKIASKRSLPFLFCRQYRNIHCGRFLCGKLDKGPTQFDCLPDLDYRSICVTDPFDVSKCYDQPRVVIIGAGMAGLAAAARLAVRGITNFTVLEAYARPGGRIHSCWFGDVVAELGSQWNKAKSDLHPAYVMRSKEDPPRPAVPGSEHTRSLFRKLGYHYPYPPMINAYQKFRQIEKEAAQIYCLGSNKTQGSLLNFVSLRIQQELHEYPEEQQHEAARIMFGLAHLLITRCGDDTGYLCVDNQGCFMSIPGGVARCPLGLMGTLAPLLRAIPKENVIYKKPVHCVYWGTTIKEGYRSTVVTLDGDEFPCDYVISTVSLGVLGRNAMKMFCPALPATKCDALRCIGYGCCNKIYLEYCRPFWFWHNGNLNFYFHYGELCGRCDWTRGIIAIEVVTHSKHVLCIWVAGPEAMNMEIFGDRDVAVTLTDLLRRLTYNPRIPYPSAILRSNWGSDPYFLGSYSYDCCNSGGHLYSAIAAPLPEPSGPVPPVLLFAGEATVPGHNATVRGAQLSGIREAERIVELTVQCKGPPVLTKTSKKAKEENTKKRKRQ